MTQRIKRIQRILEIRDKELRERVARLTAAQQQEAEAEGRLERASVEFECAMTARRDVYLHPTDAASLMEAEEWLAVKSYCVDVSRHQLAKAQRVRGRMQVEVLRARDKIRQLEKVAARLRDRHRAQLERREQREHDELAALFRRRVNER